MKTIKIVATTREGTQETVTAEVVARMRGMEVRITSKGGGGTFGSGTVTDIMDSIAAAKGWTAWRFTR
jgi:hypothetical protein